MIDRLDHAERLGLIPSTAQWLELRDQMIHEYVEDPQILADALDAARRGIDNLAAAGDATVNEFNGRGW